MLPRPLHDNGPRLVVLRMAAYNPDEYNFIEINRASSLMHQIMLDEDDDAIVNGVIHILDLSDVKAGHFFQMTPSFAKKMTVFQEEALPMRTKGTHFINTPAGFDKVFNMFKPMMSKKQQQRVGSLSACSQSLRNSTSLSFSYSFMCTATILRPCTSKYRKSICLWSTEAKMVPYQN